MTSWNLSEIGDEAFQPDGGICPASMHPESFLVQQLTMGSAVSLILGTSAICQ